MEKIVFFLFFITVFSCRAQQPSFESKEETEIHYSAFTRGRKINVDIKRDTIFFLEKGWDVQDSLEVPLSEKQELRLDSIINAIDLSALSDIPAPSNRRQTDGDWHARIEISTGNATYKSQSFDKREPIRELIPLIMFMQEILDKDLGIQR